MNPSATGPRLSVVIPCFNESRNLPLLLERLAESVADRRDIDVILVENGSTDDSAGVLNALLAGGRYPFASVCTVAQNRGYGFGILAGLQVAAGDIVGWTHADLQTDPRDVVMAFDRMRARPDHHRVFLKGRRRARPVFDVLFTMAMSAVASVMLRTRLLDVNAQPKLFSRELVPLLADAPPDFSLDLYALWRARGAGWTLMTHDVDFGARRFGEAKGGGGVSLRGKLRLARRTLQRIAAMSASTSRGHTR